MLARPEGRQILGQPRTRGPRRYAARLGSAEFQSGVADTLADAVGMKLHCEVEVVSRHLPALGLRNRGKGVRAVLSLGQQTPRSQPRPRAGSERGGGHPVCLLICTLKDKRGTRYEVRGASRPCQGSRPLAVPLSREAGRPRDSRDRAFPRLESVLGGLDTIPVSGYLPVDPKEGEKVHLIIFPAHFCNSETTALQPHPSKAFKNSAFVKLTYK